MKSPIQPRQTKHQVFWLLLVFLTVIANYKLQAQTSSESGAQVASDIKNDVSLVIPTATWETCMGYYLPFTPQGKDEGFFSEDYFVPGPPDYTYTFNLTAGQLSGSGALCNAPDYDDGWEYGCPDCSDCDCAYGDLAQWSLYALNDEGDYVEIYESPVLYCPGDDPDPYDISMSWDYASANGIVLHGTDVIEIDYLTYSEVAENKPEIVFSSAACTSTGAGTQATIEYPLPAFPAVAGDTFTPVLSLPNNFVYPQYKLLVNNVGCTINQDTGEITTGTGTGEIEVECYEDMTLNFSCLNFPAGISKNYVTKTIQVVTPPEIELDPSKPYLPYAGGNTHHKVYFKVNDLSTFNSSPVWTMDTDPNDWPDGWPISSLGCTIGSSTGVLTLGDEPQPGDTVDNPGLIVIKAADPIEPDYYLLYGILIYPEPTISIDIDTTLAPHREALAYLSDPNAIASPNWTIHSRTGAADCTIVNYTYDGIIYGLIEAGNDTGTITVRVTDSDGYYVEQTVTIEPSPTLALSGDIDGDDPIVPACLVVDSATQPFPGYIIVDFTSASSAIYGELDQYDVSFDGPDLGCQLLYGVGWPKTYCIAPGSIAGTITVEVQDPFDGYVLVDQQFPVRPVPSVSFPGNPNNVLRAWGSSCQAQASGQFVGGLEWAINPDDTSDTQYGDHSPSPSNYPNYPGVPLPSTLNPQTTVSASGLVTSGVGWSDLPYDVDIWAVDPICPYYYYTLSTLTVIPIPPIVGPYPQVFCNPSVVPAGGSVQSLALVNHPEQMVGQVWSIVGPNLGCSITAGGLITPGTTAGQIVVRAQDTYTSTYLALDGVLNIVQPYISFAPHTVLLANNSSSVTATLSDSEFFPTTTWSISGPGSLSSRTASSCVITAGGTVGTITLTATAASGAYAGYSVHKTIQVVNVPTVSFTPNYVIPGSQATADLSDPTDFPNVTWSKVSAPEGVTVSSAGVITVPAGTPTDTSVKVQAQTPDNYTFTGTINIQSLMTVAFSKNPLNADGQSATWAAIQPAGAMSSVIWSIQGPSYGCRISPTTGQIIAGKISGQIIIRGTDQTSGDYAEGTLQLKGGCLTPCASGNSVGGGGEFNNNSVDIAISLGYVDYGQTEASLRFEASTPSAAVVTPALLWVAGSESLDVEIIPVSGTDTTIQQVKTPAMLAVMHVVSSSQYNVNLYSDDQIAQQSHTLGTPYTLNAGATPFCTWTIANPTPGNYNHVVVTETRGGKSYVADYTYRTDLGSAVGNGWDMLVDGGTRKERRTKTANPTDNTETYTIRDAATDTVKYQEVRTCHTFPWDASLGGDEVTSLTVGTGPNALTTTWVYYTVSSDTADYTHIQQVLLPGGSWETYKYDSQGRKIRVVSQFLDNPLPASTTDENNNRVTTTTYDDVNNIAEETVTLQGTEISHKYTQTVNSVNGSDDIVTVVQCQNHGVTSMTAPGNLKTVNNTYPAGSQIQYLPHLTTRPDGTIVLYSYSIANGQETKVVKEGQPNANNTDVIDGVKTVTVLDHAGNVVSEQQFDIINSSLPLSSKIATAQDVFGRPLTYTYGDGSTEKMTYSCCGMDTMTGRSGVQTSYDYDNMKRLSLVTKAGISTLSQYNVIGKLGSVTRITPNGSGSDSTVLNSYQYDNAGRLQQSTDLIGTTTDVISTDANAHQVITTTYPNQSTLIETYYKDGSRFSVGGTSVYPSTFQYGVDSDGVYKTEIRPRGASNGEWVKASLDMLNRQYKVSYPLNADGQTPFNQYYYSQTTGQLWKQRDPDGIVTLYAYNNRGELYQQAVDMDKNDQISTAIDRVQEFSTSVQPNTQNSEMLAVNHNYVWDQPDSGGPVKTETLTTTYAIDGSYTNTTSFGQSTTWTVAYDPANQTRTETQTLPDNTQSISVYVNDRLNSLTVLDASNPRQQLSQQTYQYYTVGTHYGFLQSVTDARNGTTSYTYNSEDRIASITTPVPGFGQTTPQATQYNYDELNPAGHVVTTTMPDLSTVTRTYQLTGEQNLISGSGVIPTQYTYEQGRVKTIKTWRTYGNDSTAEVTTFNYTADRGFLASKTYPNSAGPSYTYYDSGRVKTRTWPGGATTTYTYNNAGDQWQVDYSDTTASPDITYTYNARGQVKTVTDQTGTCATTYYANGLPYTETHTGGALDGVVVEYDYDTYLRRQTTIARKNGAEIYRQANAYNPGDSRVRDITFDGICAQHDYEPNSSLVRTVTLKQGTETGATILSSSREHNYLNQLLQTATAGSDATISFTGQFNALGKRQRVTLQDGSYWVYTYDTHGQLTSGKKYWSDGTPVAGQQFEYAFDDVGNRTSTKAGGDSTGQNLRAAQYQVNGDNQYTSRDVPHYADVMGTANAPATVTVTVPPDSILQTQRKDAYFWAQVPVPNSYNPFFPIAYWLDGTTAQIIQVPPGPFEVVTVQAVRWDNQQSRDVMSTSIKTLFLPQSPQNFSYLTDNYEDPNGSLTFDSDWTYSWDAENRLVSMWHMTSPSPQVISLTKISFAYDYMGRRVMRTVQLSNDNGITLTTKSITRYIYDGWNLLYESNDAVSPGDVPSHRSYAWGPDDNGSLNNAGATAPLMVEWNDGFDPSGTYYVAQDVLGNVNSLFNVANGTQAAAYDYGPFGEPLRGTGVAAAACRFGFAGKYSDAEAGLVYYGRRFYSPSQGRWLSRDPIEETGGVNLYGFVGNDPINQQDLLGLILWDNSSSFWVVYMGRVIDPRSLYQNIVSGDSFNVASSYSYHVLMAPVQLGRAVIHPINTGEALLSIPGMISSGQLKCLLGDKYDEFLQASPDEQMDILGGIIGDASGAWATGAGAANGLQALRGLAFGTEATELSDAASVAKYVLEDGELGKVNFSPPVFEPTGNSLLDALGLQNGRMTVVSVEIDPSLAGADLVNVSAHESFHIMVNEALPNFAVSAGRMPYIGAFPLYLEESGAYAYGAASAGQYGRMFLAPVSAFNSLSPGQAASILGTGVGVGGLYYYAH